MILTVERLKCLLSYDPLTGIFTHLRRDGEGRGTKSFNNRFAGTVAGRVASDKYIEIGLDRRQYLAHRLAWLYMTGEWPIEGVDHRNRNKRDNRWENLREATNAQNGWNRGAAKNNALGLKGVYLYKPTQRYLAQIQVNGKRPTLGYFDCPAAAHFAYIIAADNLHGEFSRTS